jgi:flagellar biosynthesis protein FlhG
VSAAVRRQKPFLLEYPNSMASKGIRTIAQRLLDEPEKPTGGMKQFLRKMIGFFNS